MTHGQRRKQINKQRRAIHQRKRQPLVNERCAGTGKVCWTRDAARSQARYVHKRDGVAMSWYRCDSCQWFHLGHD